jgi:hypothetical protein
MMFSYREPSTVTSLIEPSVVFGKARYLKRVGCVSLVLGGD